MTNPLATDSPRGDNGPLSTGPDPKMLDMLVCPVAYVPLRYDAGAGELISDQAGLAYPIRDGIPVMIPEQARVLDPHAVR